MDDLRLNIRKAEWPDAPIITDFNLRMARETEAKELDPEVALAGVKAILKDNRKGFYLLAETAHSPATAVGQLMVTSEWSDWRNRWFWWLQSVYVQPEYRNRRVFGRLFRHLEEMARFHRDVAGLRLYVEKHNTAAKAVYETLGLLPTAYDMFELEFQ